MQAIQQGMHSGDPDRSADGVFGRIMRSLLQLRTSQSQSGESQRVDVSGETKPGGVALAPKVRFREPQIEMAHGAGGKASRRLIEGLFVPLLYGQASSDFLGDAAHVAIAGAPVAVTTDAFVVK